MNNFTAKKFRDWLEAMGVTHEEAAELLKISVSKVHGYAFDTVRVSNKHLVECQRLLQLKSQKDKQNLA